MIMLSRGPYYSLESAQNKIVMSASFEGGDVFHSSNHDVAQKAHEKKKRFMKFVRMQIDNHIGVNATQYLPSGPVLCIE